MGRNNKNKEKPKVQLPYSPSTIQLSNTFHPLTSKSEYQIAGEYVIASLEPTIQNLSIPQILNQYYPPNTHFVPKASGLTKKFYETILTLTNSIKINHTIKDGEIIYSKIKILHILLPSEWNQNLSADQMVRSPTGKAFPYNYWNYQRAWDNTLLLKNSNDRGHSWFITFILRMSKPFPTGGLEIGGAPLVQMPIFFPPL